MQKNQSALEKLDKLIQQVEKTVAEKKMLQDEVLALKENIKSIQEENKIQKNHLEVLEQQNKMVNIARVVSNFDDSEKKSIKKLISTQIKEIDQCIKLLKL